MGDINRKMAHGAFWMVLFKLLERSIGLVSTVILARLLIPEDFGLIAMATAIIAVLELLGAFNFDVALIQNSQAGRSHYDTAFTCNVLFGLSCALLLLLLAWPAANFYHEARLAPVMAWLAFSTAIGGFENIGVVAFRKEMRFEQEFKFLLAKKLIAFCVTMILAFILRSYWALVVGMLTSRICGVVISYLSQSYRPRFSLAARNELFRFSRWLIFNNILFFLLHRSADFIIGRFAGSRGLGLYTLAYEISNLPSTELVAPINRAVFPGYAKIAGDPAALRDSYLDVAGMIALIAMPICAGIAAVAEPLVLIMLGGKWQEAGPLIRILAIYGLLGALLTNTGAACIAVGKPKLITAVAVVQTLILIPLLVIGTKWGGVMGAAWACLFTGALAFPLGVAVTLKTINLKFKAYVQTIWRPVSAACGMYLLVNTYLALTVPGTQAMLLLQLLSAVSLGALAYIGMTLTLWKLTGSPRGAEKAMLAQIKPRIPERFKSFFNNYG